MDRAKRYPLSIFWSEEDGAYVAEARDLPGCSAVGDSQAEAVAEAQNAIASWIEAAEAAGNPVPNPSTEIGEHGYSGKLLLRMPKSLHAGLARRAAVEGVSLNQWAVHLLSSGPNPYESPTNITLVEFKQVQGLAYSTAGGATITNEDGQQTSIQIPFGPQPKYVQ